MSYNTEYLLRVIALILLIANVLVLWKRQENKVECVFQGVIKQQISTRSMQPANKFSPHLPAKCASLLRDVDPLQGLILGEPRKEKVFLTLGVAVWDDNIDNIAPMLNSFISHVTPEDASDVTIVISVSPKCSSSVKQLLKDEFRPQVQSGLVHLISPTSEYIAVFTKHPSLGDFFIKEFSKNFTEKVFEINKNIGFLLYYANRMSEFVLHLSDQHLANSRFLPHIKHHVAKNQNETYFALLFSQMKLMPAAILEPLNEFYTMFGMSNSPFIAEEYQGAKISININIDTNLDLFPLRSITCNRPNAKVKTSLQASDAEHGAENVYRSDSTNFFWALTPQKDDYLQITFDDPIGVSRLQILSGSPFFKDTPQKAMLKVCAAQEESKSCNITNCQEIANIGDPVQDIKGLESVVQFLVKCIRLEFIEKGKSWAIIRNIAVCTP